MKGNKKLLCIVLTGILVASNCAIPVSAENTKERNIQLSVVKNSETVQVGTEMQCGDSVYATLDDYGTLTISGNGDMWDGCIADARSDVLQIIIEDGVTSIGANAFERAEVTKVAIGKDVMSIGENAFFYCSDLVNIDIPGNVIKIGENAFFGTSLKSCTFHEGLQEIGNSAFERTELTSIKFPESLISIGEKAFYSYAAEYKSVTIPKNVKVINKQAFYIGDGGKKLSFTVYSDDVLIGFAALRSTKATTIRANRGSTAEAYASKCNCNFQPLTYKTKVTFDENGGYVNTTSKMIISESRYGALPEAYRRGYAFKGWYTAQNGGKKVTSDTVVTTRVDSTLYAHWEKIVVNKCKAPTLQSKLSKKMVVKIKKVKGAKGYQIRYSLKSNMKSAKSVNSSSATKTLKGLKLGKKYYFQVRAYKLDSVGKKVYGQWSAKKSANTKK